jgi:hypothetical protein
MYWEPLLPAGNFTVCGPGRFLLVSHTPQFVSPGWSLNASESVGEQTDHWVLFWLWENWGLSHSVCWSQCFSVILSAGLQFTSLWARGGCGNVVIQRIWTNASQSCLAVNARMQFPWGLSAFRPCIISSSPCWVEEAIGVMWFGRSGLRALTCLEARTQPGGWPWRLNATPATGLVVFSAQASGNGTHSSPGRVEPTTLMPFTLELLCRTKFNILPLFSHLLWMYPT